MMLSMPRTISRTVSVNSAIQACGSAIQSMGRKYKRATPTDGSRPLPGGMATAKTGFGTLRRGGCSDPGLAVPIGVETANPGLP